MTYREPALVTPAVASTPTAGIVANAASLFPRRHPSATLGLVLGLLSLVGLGPLVGVPAIVLSELVLREVARAPRLYVGSTSARVGLVAGWTGTLLWSGACLLALGREFVALAFVSLAGAAVLVGIGAWLLLSRRPQRDHRHALPAVAASALTLFGGGVGGAVLHAADAREMAAKCDAARERAQKAASVTKFDEARQQLKTAYETCKGPSLAAARAFGVKIPELEEQQRKSRASERFEKARSAAARTFADVRTLSAATKFVDADERLRDSLTELGAFRDFSHIVEGQPWKSAVKDIADERARIAPGVDAELRARTAAATNHARALSAQRRWDDALQALVAAESLRGAWKPLAAFEREWRKVDADIDRERTRANSGADGERRRKEAAAEAEQKREEARQHAAETAEAARAKSKHLACCDGTVSPRCLCSRDSFRGCCSHHGGICGGCD